MCIRDREVTSRILAEANQVIYQDFVGFDFAGDEHNYSPEDIRPLIEQDVYKRQGKG